MRTNFMLWLISRKWLWHVIHRHGITIYEHIFMEELIAFWDSEPHSIDKVIKITATKYLKGRNK